MVASHCTVHLIMAKSEVIKEVVKELDHTTIPYGYVLVPDNSGFSTSEMVAVGVSGVMALIATILIFMPIFVKDHNHLQSAGLGILTAAATAARQGVKG